ncbi:hypothetical protein NADFUDRAFT_50715 [Nadsonia fulvescens var. elongata DSM 6958]|uniref:Arrestin C-terminal-like domain-containing protein n=1 Tax=Nadsonia fulvescens var. elongata DSM 6958 TaxID=857566 RepID=A0A1E3PMZ1_9ASCO|nr:hypothetical protein NADFUDRAFT_50715 [Nadsonia fulvescens var. elongata DSM 6958]
MSVPLEVKVNGPPNEDIIRGFPGISATWPRLEGIVEIRSKDADSVLISRVSIALYRTDTINPPSNKPTINGPKKDQSFLVGKELNLFQVSAGKPNEEVIGMDLPFILELPTNRPLPASLSISKTMVESKYQLFVSILYGKQQILHIASPVRIKRYDTLSTFGSFKVPIYKSIRSSDHLVDFDFSLPISSYGPLDSVLAYVKITPNADLKTKIKRIKLLKVSMQIIEIIHFNHEGDDPSERRRRIAKVSEEVDKKLIDGGYTCQLQLDFPTLELKEKDGLISKERQDIPLCAQSGFTTSSALYRLEYALIFKAKLSHSKDIEIEQPITVSPFDHTTCTSFMSSIAEAVEQANRIDRSLKPPFRIYKSTDASALWHLGLSPRRNNNSGSNKLSVLVL